MESNVCLHTASSQCVTAELLMLHTERRPLFCGAQSPKYACKTVLSAWDERKLPCESL